jgi:hypothetical protein
MKHKQNRFEIVRDKKPKEKKTLGYGTYTQAEFRRLTRNKNTVGNWTPFDIYDYITIEEAK